MNTYAYLAILVLVLIVVVALPIAVRMLKRKANAAARAAGGRMGASLQQKIQASNEQQSTKDALILGTYLHFADAASGSAVATSVLQSAKNATLPWTIAHGTPDAITATWTSDRARGTLALAHQSRWQKRR